MKEMTQNKLIYFGFLGLLYSSVAYLRPLYPIQVNISATDGTLVPVTCSVVTEVNSGLLLQLEVLGCVKPDNIFRNGFETPKPPTQLK